MKNPKLIDSLLKLDHAIADGAEHDFAIMLNGGVFSRKGIQFKSGTYRVFNYIDDTKQRLTGEQLFDASITNIGKAIKLGGFFEL